MILTTDAALSIAYAIDGMRTRLCGYPVETLVDAVFRLDEMDGFQSGSRRVNDAYHSFLVAARHLQAALASYRNTIAPSKEN